MEDTTRMNILVTGGAGYLGSELVQMLLASGHRVRVLDNMSYGGRPLLGVWTHPSFELVRGNICDGETTESALEGIDAVVHLAAIVGDPAWARQPELARATNLETLWSS